MVADVVRMNGGRSDAQSMYARSLRHECPIQRPGGFEYVFLPGRLFRKPSKGYSMRIDSAEMSGIDQIGLST